MVVLFHIFCVAFPLVFHVKLNHTDKWQRNVERGGPSAQVTRCFLHFIFVFVYLASNSTQLVSRIVVFLYFLSSSSLSFNTTKWQQKSGKKREVPSRRSERERERKKRVENSDYFRRLDRECWVVKQWTRCVLVNLKHQHWKSDCVESRFNVLRVI